MIRRPRSHGLIAGALDLNRDLSESSAKYISTPDGTHIEASIITALVRVHELTVKSCDNLHSKKKTC